MKTASESASTRPKPLRVPLKPPRESCSRLPLQVGSRSQTSGRESDVRFLSKNLSRFSPLILTHKARVQHSLGSSTIELICTLYPHRICCLLTQQHDTRSDTLACACCGTQSGFPRQTVPPASRVPYAPEGDHIVGVREKRRT